jgi:hypothetical protein
MYKHTLATQTDREGTTAFRGDGFEFLSPLLCMPQPSRSVRGRHLSMAACAREIRSELLRARNGRSFALARCALSVHGYTRTSCLLGELRPPVQLGFQRVAFACTQARQDGPIKEDTWPRSCPQHKRRRAGNRGAHHPWRRPAQSAARASAR